MHKNVKATSSFIFKGAPGLLTCSVSPRSYNPRQSHIHDPKVCRADKECSMYSPAHPTTPFTHLPHSFCNGKTYISSWLN